MRECLLFDNLECLLFDFFDAIDTSLDLVKALSCFLTSYWLVNCFCNSVAALAGPAAWTFLPSVSALAPCVYADYELSVPVALLNSLSFCVPCVALP